MRLHQGDYDDGRRAGGRARRARAALRRGGRARGSTSSTWTARARAASGPELVRAVAEAAAPALLQASGGIRSLDDAAALLAAGADRVDRRHGRVPAIRRRGRGARRAARRRARRPRRPGPDGRLDRGRRALARRRGRALPRGRRDARPLHGDRPRRHARRARPRARAPRGGLGPARDRGRAACARRPTSPRSPRRAPRPRSSGRALLAATIRAAHAGTPRSRARARSASRCRYGGRLEPRASVALRMFPVSMSTFGTSERLSPPRSERTSSPSRPE